MIDYKDTGHLESIELVDIDVPPARFKDLVDKWRSEVNDLLEKNFEDGVNFPEFVEWITHHPEHPFECKRVEGHILDDFVVEWWP
jgi:hypothetical protein